MLIPNLVKDIFLAVKVKGTWNLYARKHGGKLWLLGTFYDEFHAVKCRQMVCLMYGFKLTHLSSEDVMRTIPERHETIVKRVQQLNLNSRNKMVRAHAKLVEDLQAEILPWNPQEYAAKLLQSIKD